MRPNVRRKWWYAKNYLSTHPCIDCGERDVRVLEFDHRGNKIMNIAQGIWKLNFEEFKEEIDKCDIRCANDHKRRHWFDNERT